MNRRWMAYACWGSATFLLLVAVLVVGRNPPPSYHVGDAASTIDPALFDPEFPEMAHWAAAGVLGGIPRRSDTPVMEQIQPGEDIQAAVSRVAEAGGGVVKLAPGRYEPSTPIVMRSGVILRGSGADQTHLAIDLRSSHLLFIRDFAIQIDGCERVGIEDLSLSHPVVAEIPIGEYRFKYKNDLHGREDLRTGLIGIAHSKNCWVQNCVLTASGSSPVAILTSRHITMRFNVVDGAYNKGDRGNGYYLIAGSIYVLCANETVRNLRHFSIQNHSLFCVVLACRLETDLNFHVGDWGRNLVESCDFSVPGKHHWPAIAWWKEPRGERNFIYRATGGKGKNRNYLSKGVTTEPNMLYEVLTTNEVKPILMARPEQIPKHKTLFARTGHRDMPQP